MLQTDSVLSKIQKKRPSPYPTSVKETFRKTGTNLLTFNYDNVIPKQIFILSGSLAGGVCFREGN